MVVWFKKTVTNRGPESTAIKEIKTEVSELQDAVIDLAEFISEVAERTGGEYNG